jgi:hypothetical protein
MPDQKEGHASLMDETTKATGARSLQSWLEGRERAITWTEAGIRNETLDCAQTGGHGQQARDNPHSRPGDQTSGGRKEPGMTQTQNKGGRGCNRLLSTTEDNMMSSRPPSPERPTRQPEQWLERATGAPYCKTAWACYALLVRPFL